MPLTPAVVTSTLAYQSGLCVYLSVHTGDPSTTGANEATGGSYARKQITWTAPASGSTTGSAGAITPGAGTFNFGGYWSAATGGTFLGGFSITSKTLGASDTITVTPQLTLTEA